MPYRHAWYDLGQSVAIMSVQATKMELSVHQIGGFEPSCVQQEFQVPEDFSVVTILAVGYHGSPEDLPEDFRVYPEKRQRKTIQEIIAENKFPASE